MLRVRTTGPAARAGVAQAAVAAQPRGGALQQQGVLDEQHVAQAHETRLVDAPVVVDVELADDDRRQRLRV